MFRRIIIFMSCGGCVLAGCRNDLFYEVAWVPTVLKDAIMMVCFFSFKFFSDAGCLHLSG